MSAPIFNDYDENGFRCNIMGCRSSRIQDDAIVRNLRHRWRKELEQYSDVRLINEYDTFAMHDDWFGNNDERFLEWLATSAE